MRYKFSIGDKVKLRFSKDEGKILSRRFSLFNLIDMMFWSIRYYVVMLQHEYTCNGELRISSRGRTEITEGDLELATETKRNYQDLPFRGKYIRQILN